uniref:Uncharacterized protein n=1 Tax=viral metagenome TaxID=1070528 RepID=A0A6M3JEC0_9ZZZZ
MVKRIYLLRGKAKHVFAWLNLQATTVLYTVDGETWGKGNRN